MPNPFHHDPHPDLTKAILGVVNESHTRAQLEKLSITRLRELKKKYEALVLKGDKNASRELADIRGLLRSKGAGVVVDESRMVGGEDLLQGVKNLVTGKGFKTNREVVGDRVNANYAAMKKKKKKSGKTPVAEGMTPCEAAALKRLQSAEAADLKEYPGKRGEAAHKRLHKTIGSILKKK